MQTEIVPHPETGKPAEKVVSYVELDRTQLEAEVNQKQSEYDTAAAEKQAHDAQAAELDTKVSTAEAALGDSKSKLASHDAISPQPSVDAGAEGTSSPDESTDEVGDESDGAGEPAGDAAEDPTAEVSIPVTVETDETKVDEY